MKQGEYREFTFTIRDANGEAIDLTNYPGYVVTLSVKRYYSDTEAVIEKTSVDGITMTNESTGQGRAVILEADTAGLDRCVYYIAQLWVALSEGQSQHIDEFELFIESTTLTSA
jgi:hypothetical protein